MILAILGTGIVGVVLFRVGAAEKPHSVLLKWNPAVPKPGVTIAAYKIYRSSSDGNFEPLASAPSPTYVDTKVSSGATYQYFVVAVDSAGNRSPPSNTASATIR